MVRLVRLVKLYKIATEKRKHQKIEAELMELVKTGAIPWEALEQRRNLFQQRDSKLSSVLSEIITQRVIVLVLVMLICVPLLTTTTVDNAPMEATHNLHIFNYQASSAGGEEMLELQFNKFKEFFMYRKDKPFLLELTVINSNFPDMTWNTWKTGHEAYVDSLRDTSLQTLVYPMSASEYTDAEIENFEGTLTKAVFSKQILQRRLAYLQISLTVFVSIMLVAGAVILNDDVEKLVLTPINKMMNLVETIAKDPLKPIQVTLSLMYLILSCRVSLFIYFFPFIIMVADNLLFYKKFVAYRHE